jgi:membrane-bound lytic murein transglycosylase B
MIVMLLRVALCLVLASGPICATAAEIAGAPGLESFIDEMQKRHGFERAQLEKWFGSVSVRRDVISAMDRPAEALPWHKYRTLFVNADSIARGVEYYHRHASVLSRAEAVYGVAPEFVVAIIGVESRYGRQDGSHPVLDTLTTLAFHYPRRATFFRRELEHFLLMAREEGFDPASVKGSYAGAMGKAQFIASSYRAYAVDFDGDRRRDLIGSTDDAIGSVANYLHRHGWRPGGPVASDVRLLNDANVALAGGGPMPDMTIAEFYGNGVQAVRSGLNAGESAALHRLDGARAPVYRLGFHNFYVITRYNRSINYAMAVYELGNAIRLRIDGGA